MTREESLEFELDGLKELITANYHQSFPRAEYSIDCRGMVELMTAEIQLHRDKIDSVRPEGVYCAWALWPPGIGKVWLLTIERVNGNATVSSIDCTMHEAEVIREALNEELSPSEAKP